MANATRRVLICVGYGVGVAVFVASQILIFVAPAPSSVISDNYFPANGVLVLIAFCVMGFCAALDPGERDGE